MIEKLKFDRLYYNKDIIIQSLLNKVDELVEKVNYLEQNNGQGSGISNNPLLGNRTLTPDTLCECGCPNNKFAHKYCATNCERFENQNGLCKLSGKKGYVEEEDCHCFCCEQHSPKVLELEEGTASKSESLPETKPTIAQKDCLCSKDLTCEKHFFEDSPKDSEKCKCGLFDWANLCESCQSQDASTSNTEDKNPHKNTTPDICICKWNCTLPFCFPRNHGKCCECSKVKDG